MEDALDVQCIMLSSMSPELQRQHENMSAREIDQHLRKLFQESARVESMDKSLTDLMVMLKIAEKNMKVNPSLHAMMVRNTNKRPGTEKFNPKANAVKNPKYQAQKKLNKGMQVPQSDEKEAMCFHCGKKDSGSSSHICANMQGLSDCRRLSKGEMDLRAANGERVAVLAARGAYTYFVTFTDDLSRYGYVYLMRHKSETLDKFKEFKNEVEKQRGKKIKALRSDRGGEYLS
ncbi:uncharacterized protein LOC122031527 [Zingiber officinale]|uniref:uncharacterized protein LOC122031527 n=1 Tax=Zingiber officinale TaxID=94328 RepID=UPI001C4DC1B0|nr:uncharacterized protein LOC122031527 [Zingiber officinale]